MYVCMYRRGNLDSTALEEANNSKPYNQLRSFGPLEPYKTSVLGFLIMASISTYVYIYIYIYIYMYICIYNMYIFFLKKSRFSGHS